MWVFWRVTESSVSLMRLHLLCQELVDGKKQLITRHMDEYAAFTSSNKIFYFHENSINV